MQAVLLRFALLKAEYMCPSEKVLNKQCGFISKKDVNGIPFQTMNVVEGILQECRRILLQQGSKVSAIVRTRLLGKLDLACARFAVGKQKHYPQVFASAEAAAAVFVQDLSQEIGENQVNPWKDHLPSATTPSASAPVNDDMVEFTAAGELVHKGPATTTFSVGSKICMKGKDDIWTVDGISDKTATIKRGEETCTVKVVDLMRKFSNYEEKLMTFENDFAGNFLKAKVVAAISTLATQHDTTAGLKAHELPVRRLVADAAFKPNKLIIVPMSTAVQQKAGINGVVATVDGQELQIMPPPKSCTVPYWLVRSSAAPNMQVATMTVTLAASAKLGTKAFDSTSSQVTIPCLVNNKSIKPGEEICKPNEEVIDKNAGKAPKKKARHS